MLNRGALRCAVAGALTLTLMACGGQTNETAATTDAATYKDGTYTATTDVFTGADGRDFGYGVATVTITDGKISACTFETYTPEGELIDENTYSYLTDENLLKMAAEANKANGLYAQDLVDKGDLSQVDIISGATETHEIFDAGITMALEQAKGQ